MAVRRNRSDVDAEVDLHGLTAERLRIELQQLWSQWLTLNSVRIVHGQGTVLRPEVIRWCAEMGIPYLPDSRNEGALKIYPQRRSLPEQSLGTTLQERGLRLTAEQEAALRSPEAVERARREQHRRQLAQEQKNRAADAARAAQQRRDEELWQLEMKRLGVMEKRGKAEDGAKPRPPVILPPVRLQFDEGYWKAELSRVAETDTETLTVQKKTGLDKLAPPMKEEKPEPKAPERPAQRTAARDTAADQALFEQEMDRLGDFDGFEIRRAKRD